MLCTSASAVDIFYRIVDTTDTDAGMVACETKPGEAADSTFDACLVMDPNEQIQVEVYVRSWGFALSAVASELNPAGLTSGGGTALNITDPVGTFGLPFCGTTSLLGGTAGIYADACMKECGDAPGTYCDPGDFPGPCPGGVGQCIGGTPFFWGQIADGGVGSTLHNKGGLFMSWTGGAGAADGGLEYYAGTYIFDVPTGALGTYTMVPIPGPGGAWGGTCAYDQVSGGCATETQNLGQFRVIIEEGSCCTSATTCVENVIEADCAGQFRAFVGCPVALGGTGGPACECQTNGDCTAGEGECAEGECVGLALGDSEGCIYHDINANCDDAIDCTVDVCTAATCANTPTDSLCDDSDNCTTDTCDQLGAPGTGCTNTVKDCDDLDICTTDACNPLTGDCFYVPSGLCTVSLCMDAVAFTRSDPSDCLPAGSDVELQVNIELTTFELVAAQVRFTYETDKYEFLDLVPGAECGATGGFTHIEAEIVDEVNGVIFASVLMDDGGVTTGWYGDGPAACAYFKFIGDDVCGPAEFCFEDGNPAILVTDIEGNIVPIEENPICDGDCTYIKAGDTPVSLTCPASMTANADCNAATATVSFPAPTAYDQCADEQMVCGCVAGQPGCQDAWAMGGGTMPQGVWEFECTATDPVCGDTDDCTWSVTVTDLQSVVVEVELSPVVASPLDRCIEFEMWRSCTPEITEVEYLDMTFGDVGLLDGHAAGTFKVDKGNFQCIAARDPLHTLRSCTFLECDGIDWVGTWKGDPAWAEFGHFLIGGNLDGWRSAPGSPRTIDIVDYAIFVSQFLDAGLAPDCATLPTVEQDADINGDGTVDDMDFTFISINFLANDKICCCDEGGPGGIQAPITKISVRQLREMGMGDLAIADLNGDGMVDVNDMTAFLGGVRPKARPGTGR
jgi:hypothetical protein